MENQSKKVLISDTNRSGFISRIMDFFTGVIFESIISVIGMYLLLNSFFIDTDTTSSPAMKYSKAGEYLLDYDVYAMLFMITNIVTLLLLAVLFKRYASIVQPFEWKVSIFSKCSIYKVFHISSIVFFMISIMNLIELLIFQIDYEWILLDILTSAGLFVTSGLFFGLGFNALKKGLKNIGELSIIAGIAFIVDSLDYLLGLLGSSIVPNYELTVSSGILILEMLIVICCSKYKSKVEQELSEINI